MEPAADFLSNLKLRVSYGLLGNQADAGLYTFASNMSLNGGLGGYIFSDGRHIYTNPAPVIDRILLGRRWKAKISDWILVSLETL